MGNLNVYPTMRTACMIWCPAPRAYSNFIHIDIYRCIIHIDNRPVCPVLILCVIEGYTPLRHTDSPCCSRSVDYTSLYQSAFYPPLYLTLYIPTRTAPSTRLHHILSSALYTILPRLDSASLDSASLADYSLLSTRLAAPRES